MKVLVTGGAGFVGSHIVDQCVREGHEVVIIDDLSSGKRSHLNPAAKFVELSITDSRVHALIEAEGIEAIIHQAAQVGVPSSIEHPLHDANINIMGTINLLEAARKHQLRFVYACSAAPYGTPEYVPVDEQHPLRPLSFYGLSKQTAEAYVLMYAEYFGLHTVSFRYANIYGPRQGSGEGSVVPVFLNRMLVGDPVYIHGDGNQTRDLIYVQDVARANVMALTTAAQGSYNISTNDEVTINELFRVLKDLTGYAQDAVHTEPRTGDIYRSVLSNEQAIKDMKWQPQTSFHDGLKETIDWWRAHLEA